MACLLGGLVFSQQLTITGGSATAELTPRSLSLLIVHSAAESQVGALFYVCNALRQKRDAEVTFKDTKFWSGLWFRLGEALLFSHAAFWLIWYAAGGASEDPEVRPVTYA